MKATDLMIGDWVNYQPGDTPQYMKVGMVSGYDIQLDLYREGGIEVAAQVWFDEENYIQPIPLTPEILEKNGFIPAVNGVSWYLGDDDTDECLLMLNEIHNAFVMSTAGMTIGFQYVHQLQHLLRLCGIKKAITLN